MITVQLAAELVFEIGEQPWLRDATREEADAFNAIHPLVGGTDGIGRPYFTVIIDESHPDCPQPLAEKAKLCSRIRWLP